MIETTVGNLLVNDVLPPDLQDHNRQIDAGGLKSILHNVAKKHPARYGEITQKLKQLGDKHAYLEAVSFSFDDFKPVDTSSIRKKYNDLYSKTRQIKSDKIRHEKLKQINTNVEKEISGKVKDYLKNPDPFSRWATVKARGNADNVRQIKFSLGNMVNVQNEVFPHMAIESLSEGLSPSSYFIGAKGARKGVVGSFIAIRDPGAFGKELFQITNDMVITENDCGTDNGKKYRSNDPHTLDRFLARSYGIYPKNHPVNHTVQNYFVKNGIKEIVVRTPLYCQSKEGVCAKCAGLLENGREAPIGDTVGLRSAQAITEPLTQLALKSKHAGGIVGEKSAFEEIKQLLHVPQNFPGAAALSQVSGTVKKIEKTPDGGRKVYVDDHSHYLMPIQAPLVKKGIQVTKGDTLSDGLVNPAELVRLKGMDPARNYLSDKMRQIYEDNGIHGHPKIYETIVRSVLNLGKVHDPGGHDFLPNEIVRWNQVQHLTKKQVETKSPLDSVGHKLESHLPHFGLKQGDMITHDIATRLHDHGIKSMDVYKQPIKINPIMIGTEEAIQYKNDILSNLGFRQVKRRLLDGMAEMKSADLHSYNPITSYVYGAEFGKGQQGKF